MLKVLWLSNVIPMSIQKELGIFCGDAGGWVSQLSDIIDRSHEIELSICSAGPRRKDFYDSKRDYSRGYFSIDWGEKSRFYGYRKQEYSPEIYDPSIEVVFKKIISDVNPDIVHIFGTEFPHTLAMVKAYGKPEKTVIHIQGLCSFLYPHYAQGIPYKVQQRFTIRDFLRQDNILQQKGKFRKRGIYEVEALKNVGHVMGRTDWDKACCKQVNPKIHYHYVQEVMRDSFYCGKWQMDCCEPHTIFISQGGYPIKGLHYGIRTLAILKKRWADVKLYVAGDDICNFSSIFKRIRKSSYPMYIASLVERYQLSANIVFTGRLSEQQMKERYLKSNVFLSASIVENSPNSVGEAMLLGVPVVASDVGGVASLIEHRKNGYLYPVDEPYLAAYYIGELFQNKGLAEKMSDYERIHAKEMYDRDKITKQLKDAYLKIKRA